MIREHVALQVIPRPAKGTRAVRALKGPGTIIVQGEVPGVSYDCGNCDSALIVDTEPGQVDNLVFRCSACGAYNEASDLNATPAGPGP